MISQQSSVKNKLLVVTSDNDFKPYIENILKKLYIVQTSSKGEEALDLLLKEFRPGVIIATKELPDMSGSEFFQKTMYFVPNATRIIVSPYTNSKEIANLKNESKSYIYLHKPFRDIELIQAVKIAFDHYNVAATLKKNNDDVQNAKKIMAYSVESFSKSFHALALHIASNDRFYYRNRLHSLVSISSAIAEEMNLDISHHYSILLSACIFASFSPELLVKFSADDPADISNKNGLAAFYKHFQDLCDGFSKDKTIEKQVMIVSQVWEHYDGSGLPRGLRGNQIFREAQIISLAGSYHSRVYRIPNKVLSGKTPIEESYYTESEVVLRHNDAMKFLFRYGKWYDIDVFNTFSKLVEKGTCIDLSPKKLLQAAPAVAPVKEVKAEDKK